MRREGGFIGTQPNWGAANRPGNWNILDIYNRQRRNLWIQSSDPFVNSVVCDLRFEGANNGTVFTDSGPLLLPISQIGTTNVVTSTTQRKYGSASGLFGNNGYLSVNHPNLALGTGNFTIEMWLFSATSRSNNGILSFGTNNNPSTTILFVYNDYLNLPNTAGLIPLLPSPLGSWFHLAYVRHGTGPNQTRLYLNGTLINQSTNSANYTQTFYHIGTHFSSAYSWGANMDNVRVTKAARYTGNFMLYASSFNPETDTYMS